VKIEAKLLLKFAFESVDAQIRGLALTFGQFLKNQRAPNILFRHDVRRARERTRGKARRRRKHLARARR